MLTIVSQQFQLKKTLLSSLFFTIWDGSLRIAGEVAAAAAGHSKATLEVRKQDVAVALGRKRGAVDSHRNHRIVAGDRKVSTDGSHHILKASVAAAAAVADIHRSPKVCIRHSRTV